ncbi:MAG: hypothetical protein CVT64_10590 [Actinobacteria bacterium HGW-Actinobacteria-4]|nr:MAG: hypothetical protein CVT64_10590 [Actinobacteria bacterium HGW-Actinobacteria-4]
MREALRRAAYLVPIDKLTIFVLVAFGMVAPLWLMVQQVDPEDTWLDTVVLVGVVLGSIGLAVLIFAELWRRYVPPRRPWRNDAVALETWSLKHGGEKFDYSATGVGQEGLVPYTLPGHHEVVWAIILTYRGLRARVEAYRIAAQGYEENERGQKVAIGADDYTICTVLTDCKFPRTVARPHRVPALLARAIALPDIEMESEDFNQRWRLVGDDARITHGLMNPLAIERFLDSHMKHTIVTFDGRAIRTVRRDFHLDVESTEAHLDALVALAATAGAVT